MSDQIRKLTNKFIVAGKLAEIESISRGVTKESKIPYISAKFIIRYGDNSASTRRVEVYSQEYSFDKVSGKKKESKSYKKILDFFNNNESKTMAQVGFDEAVAVKVEGAFSMNDYVNASDELLSSLKMDGSFFNPVDKDNDGKEKYFAQTTVEGYIHSIIPETKDGEETGRYKLNLITTTYKGEAVPITMIVPADIADDVTGNYEVGQTAQFYGDYVINKAVAKPKSGGFGTKRDEDKIFAELIVVGGEAPFEADDEKGISKETITKIMQVRNEAIDEIKAKGYLGNKNSNDSSKSTAKSSSKTTAVSSDDIPF